MKSNLPVNVASALCYVPFVGWIAAVVFLIIESEKTVRYNAVQALVLSLVLWVLPFALGITIVLAILSPLVMIAGLILEIVLAVKTYGGEKVTLPVVSKWTEKVLERLNSATGKK
ncbi:hypothetical protein A2872_01440 [Candidatus Gottesmanbacteria bacterium RIFCSPHIGHO2_01_FULL_42_12]|uniref:DUF4870 domain-containing protein n=1 Tax=Candidatus Gottesmanbacteria bacterium RIFCSPHIGHO2_01_FULL_42_12 TaxID=1798377 RepID=A0A1F5Z481_9BACT|nr:MAG: hypothetical protein A2872_01440 [Candidatus Gottesmanbacteria bacterium RIFCSPHIGHO2_01_FULL_42_12]